MATSNTFEFSEEDYERIILKESLFEDLSPTTIGNKDLRRTLNNLLTRETKLFLHAVTLSDYLRQKRIPRGLRIQKGPTLGFNNSIFCDKWCEITNKCSFDLMVLLIQEITEQLTAVRGEIETTRVNLDKTVLDKDKLKEMIAECEQQQKQLELEIKAIKKKKFHRDADDYKLQRVYTWRLKKSTRNWRTSPRRVDSEPPTSGNDTDFEQRSFGSSSSSFLEDGSMRWNSRPVRNSRTRGKRKPADGGWLPKSLVNKALPRAQLDFTKHLRHRLTAQT